MVNELLQAFEKESSINLPDFGGFMKMGTVYQFNEFLKFNDGKFSAFIQAKKGIDKNAAEILIVDFISEINTTLANGGRYDLFEIGSLSIENGRIILNKPTNVKPPTPSTKVKPEDPKNIKEEPVSKSTEIIETKKEVISEKKKELLSSLLTVKEAEERINNLSDKQDLIDFTAGDGRKTVIESLNKRLKSLNKIDPNEIAILSATEIKENKNEKQESKIKEGTDSELKKQVAKESDILKTVKEQEQKEEEKITLSKSIIEKNKSIEVLVPEKEIKEKPEILKTTSKQQVTKEEKDKEALVLGAERIEKEVKNRKRNKLILLLGLACILSGGGILGFLKKDLIKNWFSNPENKIASTSHDQVDDNQLEEVISEETIEPVEEVKSDQKEVEEPIEQEAVIKVSEEPIEDEPEIEDKQHITTTASDGSYHVIVGSFSKESNANQLVKDLQKEGFSSAGILGTFNNLQCVKLGTYTTKELAIEAMKESGKEGWIKKH